MELDSPYTPAHKGRARVQWYFSERGGTAGSVFEIFSGKGKKQGSQHAAGKKTQGFSSTRVHANETTSRKASKIPISTGLSGAPVRRAIASLPPVEQAWVSYCYGPNSSRDEQIRKMSRFVRHAWPRFAEMAIRENAHSETRARVMYLFTMQANHTNTYARLCQFTGKRPEWLTEDWLTREAWKKTYRPYWISINTFLKLVDDVAMERVSDALSL